jgi:hypothetical protein
VLQRRLVAPGGGGDGHDRVRSRGDHDGAGHDRHHDGVLARHDGHRRRYGALG